MVGDCISYYSSCNLFMYRQSVCLNPVLHDVRIYFGAQGQFLVIASIMLHHKIKTQKNIYAT